MLTSSIASSATANTAAKTSKTDLGNKNIFLKLLVAQMKNQDPLKPQDATQMSSQLAQFNMVEQQTRSNKLLQQLVGMGGTSTGIQSSGGASYLGRTATVNQNKLNYDGTKQNFSAVLDKPASEAMVYIMDAQGNPVRSMKMFNLAAGNNPITWDGQTDSGAAATQGEYSVQISATNITGADVGYVIQRSGLVDAIRFTSSGTELMVGGVAVSMSDITEIRL